MKKILVIRLGAFGDAIQITPLLRALKEDGYNVTVNTSMDGLQVLKWNPYINNFIVKKKDYDVNIDEYWAGISKGFDKVINLSGSIEETLLKPEDHPNREFYWPKEKRHAECNKNYYDYTLERGGYLHITGRNGELHFTRNEHREVKKEMRKHAGRFVVLWSLSGSSYHKAYPYAEYVATELLERYRETVVITVGDTVCKLLEWDHPRTINKSGEWNIRKSMLMTKYVDLVVGTETGILNAAGCYDTPKILMLSHSSHENLSKYWKNVHPLHADVPCQPCHQIHYTLESCPLSDLYVPVCIDELQPKTVFNKVEEIYLKKMRRFENEKAIDSLTACTV